jgi:hypothetical protein
MSGNEKKPTMRKREGEEEAEHRTDEPSTEEQSRDAGGSVQRRSKFLHAAAEVPHPLRAQRPGGDGDGEQRSAESSGPNGEGRDAVDGSCEHSDAERTDAVKMTGARLGRSRGRYLRVKRVKPKLASNESYVTRESAKQAGVNSGQIGSEVVYCSAVCRVP